MKKLAILVPEGTITWSSMILTLEAFAEANSYFVEQRKQPVFKTMLVGSSKNKQLNNHSFSVRPDKSVDEVDKVDMIIVPSMGNAENIIRKNKKNIEWVAAQYKKGAEVASLCTGAFLLAACGLLDGKQCSTHWRWADAFRAMFPQARLAIEKIITDEHGIYTTGGALSSMNLVMHLVEKYYSRETAIYISKIFEIDPDRDMQSPFIVFSGQKNHADEQIKKAQQYMEKNIGEKIIVDDLSSKFSIDRRNFDRRFKKATGNSPLEYMQRIKVEAAKKYFETSRKTVNEVMYEVGYSDIKAFREVFRRNTGLSPLEYRHKYNKEAMAQIGR